MVLRDREPFNCWLRMGDGLLSMYYCVSFIMCKKSQRAHFSKLFVIIRNGSNGNAISLSVIILFKYERLALNVSTLLSLLFSFFLQEFLRKLILKHGHFILE